MSKDLATGAAWVLLGLRLPCLVWRSLPSLAAACRVRSQAALSPGASQRDALPFSFPVCSCSDPHPGNLLKVTEGPHAGKLALLDFGLVAEIPPVDREAMVSATIHLANRGKGLRSELVDGWARLEPHLLACHWSLPMHEARQPGWLPVC